MRRHDVALQQIHSDLGISFESIAKSIEFHLDWIKSSERFELESRRLCVAIAIECYKSLKSRDNAFSVLCLAEATGDALLADTVYQLDWLGTDPMDLGIRQGLKKTVVHQNYSRAMRLAKTLLVKPRSVGKLRQKPLQDWADKKWKPINPFEASLLCHAFSASWKELASELKFAIGPRSLKPTFGRFWVEEARRNPHSPVTGKRVAESSVGYSNARQYLLKGRSEEFELRVTFESDEVNFFWLRGQDVGITKNGGRWIGEINQSNPLLTVSGLSQDNEFSLIALPK